MSDIVEHFRRNPEHLAFVVGLLCAVFNWLAKPRTAEELAALPPRLAAFFRFMSAVFPDPAKATEAIWQFWNQTHRKPSDPKPPGNDPDLSA
jgi:hypothetical protein